MPKDELYELNIGNINGGKVLEAIQDAIGKAMANVRDPNTKAEQKRKVVVTLTFAPNRERNYAEVEAKVETGRAGADRRKRSHHSSQRAYQGVHPRYRPRRVVHRNRTGGRQRQAIVSL